MAGSRVVVKMSKMSKKKVLKVEIEEDDWVYNAKIGKGTTLNRYFCQILPLSFGFIGATYWTLFYSDFHTFTKQINPRGSDRLLSILFYSICFSLSQFLLWVFPLDRMADMLIAASRIRAMIPDIIPHIPELIQMFPDLIPVIPVIPALLPYISDIAPYVGDMLVHKKFLIKLFPKMVDKIDKVAPLMKFIAPAFHKFDQRHLDKMESTLDQLVSQIDKIAPHVEILQPYMAEIVLQSDKLLPHMDLLLLYVHELKDHMHWMIDFAEVEGFDKMIHLLPELVPSIDLFAPVAPKLKDHLPLVMPHMEVLVKHIDSVGDSLPELADHIGPVLHNFSGAIPLASKMGLLDSKTLVGISPFFARQLPPVPSDVKVHYTTEIKEAPKVEKGKKRRGPISKTTTTDDLQNIETVDIPKCGSRTVVKSNGQNEMTIFYQLFLNGKYHGEYRYSDFRKLHLALKAKFGDNFREKFNIAEATFPKRTMTYVSSGTQAHRRELLEKYMRLISNVPDLINSKEVRDFLKNRAHLAQ